jgi:hypothetical protein
MPVKRKIPYSEGVYSITFTCYKWLPLIQLVNGYDLVYKWFDILKSSGNYVLGYVIMPNHLHSLLAFRNTGKEINTIIGNGKRFMAYEIVRRLKDLQLLYILEQLSSAVERKDKARGKLHEVWMDSFDWKTCDKSFMIKQKLKYFHNNPCTKKWSLAKSPVDYLHSSANFYETGEQGIYPVLNYMELDDIDLSTFRMI